jgi:hypothetical protein
LFWYAVAVILLAYIAVAVMGGGLLGVEAYTASGFIVNLLIAFPLALVGFVLPVAVVRQLVTILRGR